MVGKCKKALIYLQSGKIDPKFKGLQTELAFSYNVLGKFDKAEFSKKQLKKTKQRLLYTKNIHIQNSELTQEKLKKLI